jgi:hypothetical protein
MANDQNLKPFTKGDPRINRRGRPKSFDELRTLCQSIAHETAKSGGKPVEIDGHLATVTEVILRQWAQSKDPRLQQAFIAYAFGKVPDDVNVRGKDGEKLKIVLEYVNGSYDQNPELPPGSTDHPALPESL